MTIRIGVITAGNIADRHTIPEGIQPAHLAEAIQYRPRKQIEGLRSSLR